MRSCVLIPMATSFSFFRICHRNCNITTTVLSACVVCCFGYQTEQHNGQGHVCLCTWEFVRSTTTKQQQQQQKKQRSRTIVSCSCWSCIHCPWQERGWDAVEARIHGSHGPWPWWWATDAPSPSQWWVSESSLQLQCLPTQTRKPFFVVVVVFVVAAKNESLNRCKSLVNNAIGANVNKHQKPTKSMPMLATANAQTLKCTNAQMLKCSNAQMRNHSNAQMHKCTNAPILKSNGPLLIPYNIHPNCTTMRQMLQCSNAIETRRKERPTAQTNNCFVLKNNACAFYFSSAQMRQMLKCSNAIETRRKEVPTGQTNKCFVCEKQC